MSTGSETLSNSLGTLNTRETLARVTAVIEDSFRTRPMPSGAPTLREVNRRVDLAKGIYLQLYNECKWTDQRILDHLPAFLANGLDGLDPIPEWAQSNASETESAMWGTEAAGKVKADSRLSALAKTSKTEPLIIVPGRTVS